jgi:hypothetical protein
MSFTARSRAEQRHRLGGLALPSISTRVEKGAVRAGHIPPIRGRSAAPPIKRRRTAGAINTFAGKTFLQIGSAASIAAA